MIIYELIIFDLGMIGNESDYNLGMFSSKEKAMQAYEKYAKEMDSYFIEEYPIEESFKETHGFMINEHELDKE